LAGINYNKSFLFKDLPSNLKPLYKYGWLVEFNFCQIGIFLNSVL
jgi:hypothetical protein